MGSFSVLDFKKYTLLWSKNNLFSYDGMGLFRPEDKKFTTYEYVDEKIPYFSRKISSLKDRLDLLGYTLDRAEAEIKARISDDISLEEFIEILSFLDFNKEEDYKEDDYFVERLGELGTFISNSPEAMEILTKYWSEDELYYAVEEVNPLLILRCITELDKYSQDEIVWSYYDLVYGGWIDEDAIEISEENPYFLILTEGKTDTGVIDKCLKKFRPDVHDLFFFADTENHPFGGTKDIVRFIKGLIDIKYTGHVLVILDNDIAGNNALIDIREKYKLPNNFRVYTLPEYKDFFNVETVGANGVKKMDINGKAVAIECFFDLKDNPIIRWVNWDERQQAYQGKFSDKEKKKLIRGFNSSYDENFDNYNTSKLEFLIDFIVTKATEMS